jgi:hypothetical protein
VTAGGERIREIADANLEGNALHIGILGGKSLVLAPETSPMLWWPLPNDILRDILFGDVMVFTFYNPAHFWGELKKRGFQVTWDKKRQHPSVSRALAKGSMNLENFEHLQRLTSWSFMSQASVFELVDRWLAAVADVPMDRPARIELRHRLVRDPGLKE